MLNLYAGVERDVFIAEVPDFDRSALRVDLDVRRARAGQELAGVVDVAVGRLVEEHERRIFDMRPCPRARNAVGALVVGYPRKRRRPPAVLAAVPYRDSAARSMP